MPNVLLNSNKIYRFRIMRGPPLNDTFAVTSQYPALLGATLGTMQDGSPAVVLTPLTRDDGNLTVNVISASGQNDSVTKFDIQTPAAAIGLDLANPETQTQPVP